MAHDWLLLEPLGDEPVVVAQGRQLKNMVPLAAFLRRTLHLSAINDAVTQTARTGSGCCTSCRTPIGCSERNR